jgi:hypothetical protein
LPATLFVAATRVVSTLLVRIRPAVSSSLTVATTLACAAFLAQRAVLRESRTLTVADCCAGTENGTRPSTPLCPRVLADRGLSKERLPLQVRPPEQFSCTRATPWRETATGSGDMSVSELSAGGGVDASSAAAIAGSALRANSKHARIARLLALTTRGIAKRRIAPLFGTSARPPRNRPALQQGLHVRSLDSGLQRARSLTILTKSCSGGPRSLYALGFGAHTLAPEATSWPPGLAMNAA